jgi:hypothetical protein
VTRRWCTLNGITGVLRSHEVRQGRSGGAFNEGHSADMVQADTRLSMMDYARLCLVRQTMWTNPVIRARSCASTAVARESIP